MLVLFPLVLALLKCDPGVCSPVVFFFVFLHDCVVFTHSKFQLTFRVQDSFLKHIWMQG